MLRLLQIKRGFSPRHNICIEVELEGINLEEINKNEEKE